MGELILIAAYVLPVALVIWLWISNDSRPLKISASLMLPLFYSLQWSGLAELRGWPSEQSLPDRFQLLAADIVDPTLNQGAGSIHLWVRLKKSEQPRAYRLPYNKSLHQEIHAARLKIEQGQNQFGIIRDSSRSSSGAAIDAGRTLEFEAEPQRRLPPKRAP